MDYHLLRNAEAQEVSQHLRFAAAQRTTEEVTNELLDAIDCQALPPRIFATWAKASGEASVVNDGLRQSFSRFVQRTAILHFRIQFRTSRPSEIWAAVGGTEGVLDFLKQASVWHVKLFCREVGATGSAQLGRQERQRLTDELFMALSHRQFPESPLKSSDLRPLGKYYLSLLPACSAALVMNSVWSKKVLLAHISAFRQTYLERLEAGESIDHNRLTTLLETSCNSGAQSVGEPRVSSNMVFAIDVLRKMCERDDSIYTKGKLHELLVIPLLRRMCGRKTHWHHVEDVIGTLLQYHRKRPTDESALFDLARDGIVWYTIRHWSRCPDQLEPTLVSLLDLTATGNQESALARRIVEAVSIAPWSLRFRLLCLLFKHLKSFNVDISSDRSLKPLHFRWPPALFLALPKPDARNLLDRVVALQQLETTEYGPFARTLRWQHRGKPTCLLLYLADDANVGEMASEAISKQKQEATKARLQTDRADWARSAVEFSIASGSLNLYRDTLLWTRRFKKDPLTIQQLHSAPLLHTKEGLDLLRGFPKVLSPSTTTTDDVRGDVYTANRICEELLEFSCSALKEPSFYQPHWRPVLDLMSLVVRERLWFVDRLQKALDISNEEVYTIVWEDTLHTCLRLESMGLQAENSRLSFDRRAGSLQSLEVAIEPMPATLRFLDELAKQRNKLWEQHRESTRVGTVTLPDPYPQGLPVQCLLQVDLKCTTSGYEMPYVRERSKKAVFVDPRSALSSPSSDEDEVKAISTFIDRWQEALKLYIRLDPHPQESLVAAWNHAVGPLSGARGMSQLEAHLFWESHFQKVATSHGNNINGPWDLDPFAAIPGPQLPLIGSLQEWNPDPEPDRRGIKSRTLPTTILDAMLPRSAYAPDTAPISTVGRSVTSFWSQDDHKPWIQEALIAASILLLSEREGLHSGVLSEPFPSPGVGSRFPGLYLDDDFLEKHQKDVDHLARYLDNVPPALMLKLFEMPKVNDNGTVPFSVLRLLAQGDRPQLALSAIEELVLERPSDSSWHRSFLNQGLLMSLPSAMTKAFLERISKGIQSRLELTRLNRLEKKVSEQPVVKITTVKLLAQLLSEVEYIDEFSTVQILGDLFRNTDHHDVRLAVISSLIQLLQGTTEATVQDTVIEILAQHAVPVISNINEREPVSEQAWQELEAKKQVPDVYVESDVRARPPMLAALIESVQTLEDKSLQSQLLTKVLIPAVQENMKSNRRWVESFCQSIGVPTPSLHNCPSKLSLIADLLALSIHMPPDQKYTTKTFAPAWILELWLDIFTVNLYPPREIQAINTRVQEDVNLRGSNAGIHWLSLCNDPDVFLQQWRPTELLRTNFEPNESGNIDYPLVQEVVLKQGNILLQNADVMLSHWNSFVRDLTPPKRQQKEQLTQWFKHCRPVVEMLISRVEALRTEQWRLNRNRTPAVLPNTFTLQLWLNVYPAAPGERDFRAEMKQVTANLLALLADLCSSQRLYHRQYEELKEVLRLSGLGESRLTQPQLNQFASMMELPRAQLERFGRRLGAFQLVFIEMAISLGSLPTGQVPLSRIDYLRADLACEILRWAGVPSEIGIPGEVADMIAQWAMSLDEDVRMMGMRLQKSLRKNK